MKSFKNTVISFGMVTMPVKLYAATEDKDIHLNLLHQDCMAKINEVCRCSACDTILPRTELVRGFNVGGDVWVTFDQAELDALPVPSKLSIDIIDFVDLHLIDPMFFEKSYFVDPVPAGRKSFSLFMAALESKKVVAIGRVTLRSKETPCIFRIKGKSLIMHTMKYPDEVRTFEPELAPVKDQELSAALQLIDAMTSDKFDLSTLKDSHREAMEALIAKKLSERDESDTPAPKTQPTPATDAVMAAFQCAIDHAKTQKQAQVPKEESLEASSKKKAKVKK